MQIDSVKNKSKKLKAEVVITRYQKVTSDEDWVRTIGIKRILEKFTKH